MGDPSAAAPTVLPDAPPSLDVHDAVYVRIVLPLSEPGVNATDICELPRVTLVIVGAAGAPSERAGTPYRPPTSPPAARTAVTRAARFRAHPCRTPPPSVRGTPPV